MENWRIVSVLGAVAVKADDVVRGTFKTLDLHSAGIQAFSAIIQTAAILFGVFTAYNEFIAKDHEEQRRLAQNSATALKDWSSSEAQRGRIVIRTVSERLRTEYYQRDTDRFVRDRQAVLDSAHALNAAFLAAYHCIQSHNCEPTGLKQTLCSDAIDQMKRIEAIFSADVKQSEGVENAILWGNVSNLNGIGLMHASC